LNKDQALVPSKCEVLFNKFGTAPGMWIQKGNTIFISLPGVPFEMKNIIESEVIPRVVERFKRPYIVHKTILTYGVGESLLAERIENWENNLPDFIKLAYLPSPGRVRLRLSARGKDNNLLQKSLDGEAAKLTRLIGDAIVGFEEDETLEVILGRQLNNVGKTIATAESCTGGKIAQVISSIAGASNYFKGSVVSYSTQSKIEVLKVSSEIIKTYSVVSAEVAIEMAKQAQLIFQSDYAIATTGNAGPTKGDADAEIGTVFIALATPNSVIVEEFNFGQPREKVIDRAVNKALEMARKEILKNV
jgi:nicotinamide-nucleotide amidase